MKSVNKIAKVLTRVVEITHWVGAALMAAAAVIAAFAPKNLDRFVMFDTSDFAGQLEIYGFEIGVFTADGVLNLKAFIIFAVCGVILLSLMAMVFRNLHLIIKKSESSTPFQKDNVRMLNEIGYFSIAIPIVGLTFGIIARLILGVDAVEISNNLDGFIMGIIVLCLTSFFAHGVELENDVDGLV